MENKSYIFGTKTQELEQICYPNIAPDARAAVFLEYLRLEYNCLPSRHYQMDTCMKNTDFPF